MKKIIFTTLLYFIVTNTFSQIIKPIVNEKTKLYDYINTANNNKINKYSYDQASTFSDGMAKVNRNGLWGFINQNGDEIIPCRYLSALDFKEGLAAVSIGDLIITENFSFPNNEKYGVINKEGKVVIPFEFKEIGLYIKGLARASKLENKELWGWIDNKGNWTITPKFSDADDFNENGMAKVRIVKKNLKDQYETTFGYIDYKGNYIIQPNYSYLGSIKEGLILANYSEDGKYGFLDIKGRSAIPFNYDNAADFFEDFAIVAKKMINNEYAHGYINKVGYEIIPLEFEDAENFQNGKALVRQNLKLHWINKSGNPINANEYDVVENFILHDKESEIKEIERSRFAIVSKNGFWGAINQKGVEIIPVIYDSIGKCENGFVVLKNNTIKYLNERNELDEKLKNYFFENKNGAFFAYENQGYYYKGNNFDKFESQYENLNNISNFKKGKLLKSGDIVFNDSLIINKNETFLGISQKNKTTFIENKYDSLKYYDNFYASFIVAYKKQGLDLIVDLGVSAKEIKIYHTNYVDIENYNPDRPSGITNRYPTGFKIKQNGYWGFAIIDNQFNISELLQPIYEDIGFRIQLFDSLIPVKLKGKWGLINYNTKKIIIPFKYDLLGDYNDNNAIGVKMNNKWAFVNIDNVMVTPFKYDDIMYWSSNLCAVKLNNKWGYINNEGILKIPCIFDEVTRPDRYFNHHVKINKMTFYYEIKYSLMFNDY